MAAGQEADGDEIRVVPPGEEDEALAKDMATASKELAKQAQVRMDKELRALEKVHARHAKKAEKAARKAAAQAGSLRAELEQVTDMTVETEEQARAAHRRIGEAVRTHGPAHAAALREADIDPDALAAEIMATVTVPDHARAVGRRRQTGSKGPSAVAGQRPDADDSLGWTTEVDG